MVYVDNYCSINGEEIIKEQLFFPGGKAANIAAGLGKLKKEVSFFGNIGEDIHTQMLLEDFRKNNVDFSYVKKTKFPNSTVYSIVDKTGDVKLYAYNYVDITAEDFPDELFENTEFIVFTSLIKDGITDIYIDIAKKAKKRGIKIFSLVGNIFSNLGFERLKPLLKQCDYILAGITDVNKLVGGVFIISLLTELVPHVIVKCGEGGIKYFKHGENMKEFPAISVEKEKIIDTTGAGDCFTAAFLSSLIEGKTEEEAIGIGVYTASLSIMKKGARAMPTQEEIENFMLENKN